MPRKKNPTTPPSQAAIDRELRALKDACAVADETTDLHMRLWALSKRTLGLLEAVVDVYTAQGLAFEELLPSAQLERRTREGVEEWHDRFDRGEFERNRRPYRTRANRERQTQEPPPQLVGPDQIREALRTLIAEEVRKVTKGQ